MVSFVALARLTGFLLNGGAVHACMRVEDADGNSEWALIRGLARGDEREGRFVKKDEAFQDILFKVRELIPKRKFIIL